MAVAGSILLSNNTRNTSLLHDQATAPAKTQKIVEEPMVESRLSRLLSFLNRVRKFGL